MRTIPAVAALSLFGLMAGTDPGSAEITYPWCAQYARDGRNCGFTTLEQCRASPSPLMAARPPYGACSTVAAIDDAVAHGLENDLPSPRRPGCILSKLHWEDF